jgi:hypothetical protein
MPKVTHIKSEVTPEGVRLTAYCSPKGGTKFVVRQVLVPSEDARLGPDGRKISQEVFEELLAQR